MINTYMHRPILFYLINIGAPQDEILGIKKNPYSINPTTDPLKFSILSDPFYKEE